MSGYDTEAWQVYQEGAFPTESDRCVFCGEEGEFEDGLRCKVCAEDQDGCGCEAPHHDLDGYDRARDEAREDVWDRRERESLEQERREERE